MSLSDNGNADDNARKRQDFLAKLENRLDQYYEENSRGSFEENREIEKRIEEELEKEIGYITPEKEKQKKLEGHIAEKIDGFHRRENFIQHKEWRFSKDYYRNDGVMLDKLFSGNSHFGYDEFHLKNVNLAEYDDWFKSIILNCEEEIGFDEVDYIPNDSEHRYELTNLHWGYLLARIKTIQAGSNLVVYARGAQYQFDSKYAKRGGLILITYYKAYLYFYLAMIEHWQLEHTQRYLNEKVRYPDWHEIWKHYPDKIHPRIKINYPERNESAELNGNGEFPTATEPKLSAQQSEQTADKSNADHTMVKSGDKFRLKVAYLIQRDKDDLNIEYNETIKCLIDKGLELEERAVRGWRAKLKQPEYQPLINEIKREIEQIEQGSGKKRKKAGDFF